MKLVSIKCPNCGSNLELNGESRAAFCPFCGAQVYLDDEVQHHQVHYDNAEDAGYQFEKGRQRAQAEASTQPSQTVIVQHVVQEQPKNRKLFWWVMGWIFFFPIPLTIVIARSKKLSTTWKIILIAALWLFLIVGSAVNNKNKESGESQESAPVSSVAPEEFALL